MNRFSKFSNGKVWMRGWVSPNWLVRWEVVVKPVELGGLGIGCLKLNFNEDLLA